MTTRAIVETKQARGTTTVKISKAGTRGWIVLDASEIPELIDMLDNVVDSAVVTA